MAGTTADTALIRDLPVSDDAVRADLLADALADAVAAPALHVDPDVASPGGFERFERSGARFSTWPASVADGPGLWDRLTQAPDDPEKAPGSGATAMAGDIVVHAVASSEVPEDERFDPVEVPVRSAGGDCAWPGAVPR